MAEPDNGSTRTLLVERDFGTFKIEIPSNWKVTCGSPGGNRGFDSGGNKELRIYEAENKQRACFTGVRSFRDLSIPYSVLVVSEEGEESWFDDGEGTTTRKSKRNRKVKEVRQ